jgi:hypothetical protein
VGGKEARAPLRQVLNSLAKEQPKEALMTTMAEAYIEEGREWGLREGLGKGLAEGLARGRAEAVLRLLAVRGLSVDEQARTRILSCKDLDLLDRWLEQTVSATSLADLKNL